MLNRGLSTWFRRIWVTEWQCSDVLQMQQEASSPPCYRVIRQLRKMAVLGLTMRQQTLGGRACHSPNVIDALTPLAASVAVHSGQTDTGWRQRDDSQWMRTSLDDVMSCVTAHGALSAATTCCACASFLCLFISVTTDYWLYTVERVSDGNSTSTAVYVATSSGLWRKCDHIRTSDQP